MINSKRRKRECTRRRVDPISPFDANPVLKKTLKQGRISLGLVSTDSLVSVQVGKLLTIPG